MKSAKEYIPSLRDDLLLKVMVGFKKDPETGANLAFANRQSGYLSYNPKFDGKRVYAYGYDLNSAYLSILNQKIVDTREIVGRDRNIEEGEVGFIFDDKLSLVDEVGNYADVIFKEIDTPDRIKRYCERWYKKKETKETPDAKPQIVNSIGYLQWHNPYVRSYIVSKCNNQIKKLESAETTILCNTDAIYSTVPLDDILICGNKIGEWEKDEGYITIDKLNYTSEVFGNKHRGVVTGIKYEIRENKIYEKISEN